MPTEREFTGINSRQFQESYVQMSLNVSGKAHLHPENTTLRAYEYLMEGGGGEMPRRPLRET